MKTKFKTMDRLVRKTRNAAGKINPPIPFQHRTGGRAYDAVAFAAALEVLG